MHAINIHHMIVKSRCLLFQHIPLWVTLINNKYICMKTWLLCSSFSSKLMKKFRHNFICTGSNGRGKQNKSCRSQIKILKGSIPFKTHLPIGKEKIKLTTYISFYSRNGSETGPNRSAKPGMCRLQEMKVGTEMKFCTKEKLTWNSWVLSFFLNHLRHIVHSIVRARSYLLIQRKHSHIPRSK